MELFLDANAHLPVNTKALEIYCEFNKSIAGHGHPSSLSKAGRLAAAKLEEVRATIAKLIGAEKSEQIIFTSGCTQACEWALEIFKLIGDPGSTIFYSPVEHPAVQTVIDKLNLTYSHPFDIDSNGIINLDVYNQIPSHKKAICIHVQNELGIIQPIEKICSGILFSDMSQSLGKIPVNVTESNVDIAVFGSHKFGGPGSIGFIYLKDTSWWKPFGTGSKYFLDRAGTPDVAGIVATAAALQEAIDSLTLRTSKMILFRNVLETKLKDLGLTIVAENVPRSFNTSFVGGLNGRAPELLLQLSDKDIHIGLGSACGSFYTDRSPIMKTLGQGGHAYDYMRISQWGEYGVEEAEHFIKVFKEMW